jgi:hypothetical protein
VKELIFILSCTLIGASIMTAQWMGQADINTLKEEVAQAEELTQQSLSGNEEATAWIMEQANEKNMPYTMALAYIGSTEGRYRQRDLMIWNQLTTANSLESAVILKKFGYLFDTAALAHFIGENMDADGDLSPTALTAMRTVTFSKEQLGVINRCRDKMAYRMIPTNDLYSYRAASHWIEKMKDKKGACFMKS